MKIVVMDDSGNKYPLIQANYSTHGGLTDLIVQKNPNEEVSVRDLGSQNYTIRFIKE